MREPYGEGVASRTDPESCGHTREGVPEALTGAHIGRVLSHEMGLVRGADVLPVTEGNTETNDIAMLGSGLAWSRTPCMYGTTLRENREIPWLPTEDGRLGRIGKSKDALR